MKFFILLSALSLVLVACENEADDHHEQLQLMERDVLEAHNDDHAYDMYTSIGNIPVELGDAGPAGACHSQPCRHGAVCIPHGEGFVCQCPHGYWGKTCDHVTSLFDQHILQPNGYYVRVENLRATCLQVQEDDPAAPSGVYHLKTQSNRVVRAFCDMSTNGGGYTFLHPATLNFYSTAEFSGLVTDVKSAVVVFQMKNRSVSYGVMKQLTHYRSTPLLLTLSSHSGYKRPAFQLPYLYLGFLPESIARHPANNKQGLNINGKDLTFTNCDKNPNSFFAFFPDYNRKITRTNRPWNGFCQTVLNKANTPVSPTTFPNEFFMFVEGHWGGCGCHSMSSTQATSALRAAALGFR